MGIWSIGPLPNPGAAMSIDSHALTALHHPRMIDNSPKHLSERYSKESYDFIAIDPEGLVQLDMEEVMADSTKLDPLGHRWGSRSPLALGGWSGPPLRTHPGHEAEAQPQCAYETARKRLLRLGPLRWRRVRANPPTSQNDILIHSGSRSVVAPVAGLVIPVATGAGSRGGPLLRPLAPSG